MRAVPPRNRDEARALLFLSAPRGRRVPPPHLINHPCSGYLTGIETLAREERSMAMAFRSILMSVVTTDQRLRGRGGVAK